MNKKFIILLVLILLPQAFAGSINPAVYKTMSAQSYASNYNRQTANSTMPYWQAQSNFATRNRVYRTNDYNTRVNNLNQFNTRNSSRGMY